MKKQTVTILILCYLVSLTVLAQKQQKKQKDSIIFTQLTYDYGTIGIGNSGRCEFKFTNKMKTPLVVSNVKPSCGCTVANWPKEPVLPGKTDVIKINFNAKLPGTFNKTITVTSNAANSTVILHIKGNVILNNNFRH
jgi:hypothetical protein